MSYWSKRRRLNYYAKVASWMGVGDSLADIGGHDTPVATWGEFNRRYAVDLRMKPDLPFVECCCADFLDWEPPERLSLLTCLQVLEHVESPPEFFAKFFKISERVIVSVPHKWPAGATKSHVHDPVSLPDVCRWAKRDPWRAEIVRDGSRCRLICEFQMR